MTAPITPDERAAMRRRYQKVERPSDPYDEDAWTRYWDDPSPDVLRLLDALDTAEAEVARLRAARPAPVWDEDTVTEAVARRLHADACSEYDYAWEPNASTFRDQARELIAVVREHLPVRPDRETIADVLIECGTWCGMPDVNHEDGPCPACIERAQGDAHAVLLEWPGESRAQVQAEALRDAADAMDADPEVHDPLRLRSDWLRARADRIEKGETR